MRKLRKLLRWIAVGLGFTSSAFLVINFFIFARLRPKMIRFEAVSADEESLINLVGIGLLFFLIFCLASLLRIAKYLKNAKKIAPFSLFLVIIGVLSLLLVFGDVALLSDIGKQYKHGLSQPEWLILYPVMLLQLLTAVVFTFFHLFGFKKENQVKYVAKDSNIFMVTQYVGILCGLMGLSSSSLGFLFPRAWTLETHTTLSSTIFLTPYVLIVAYWLAVKFQEKTKQWYDEKQLQDIGKSALLTLTGSVFLMTFLFIANYNQLSGVVSLLWFPLYTFLVLLLFSLGNLYFAGKN